ASTIWVPGAARNAALARTWLATDQRASRKASAAARPMRPAAPSTMMRPPTSAPSRASLRTRRPRPQGPIEIGEKILGILQPDREPQQVGGAGRIRPLDRCAGLGQAPPPAARRPPLRPAPLCARHAPRALAAA